MTENQYPVVLTVDGPDAGNQAIVDANVTVVNAMYQALLNAEEIAPNALRSYFVDFYLTQALDGGFAQYVLMTPDRDELDKYIRDGFEGMGATLHLELFNRTVEHFDALSADDSDAYLDGDLGDDERGLSEAVQAMEQLDGEFDDLLDAEDITILSAAWLRSQDGVLFLDDEALVAHIAGRVALIPNLDERRAEADEAELENTPEFEAIIEELCAVAGHELVKITMGDPNFEHNGETVLAWHFTTNRGDFIMVEEDEEAFVINPESKEIIATVEFEDEFADA
ncbi:MAG: hypothetical protein WBX27_02490 [Specibacter sp.]